MPSDATVVTKPRIVDILDKGKAAVIVNEGTCYLTLLYLQLGLSTIPRVSMNRQQNLADYRYLHVAQHENTAEATQMHYMHVWGGGGG